MTHLLNSSLAASETLRPSASALACIASQSASSMRMFRSVVPLGIDGADEPRFEGADGQVGVPADDVAACEVFDDGPLVSGLDVLDALALVEGSGEGRDYWVAHTDECTYTCVPTQGGLSMDQLLADFEEAA